MTTTTAMPELPEPSGVIVVGTQALRAFTADQMDARYLRGYNDALATLQAQPTPTEHIKEPYTLAELNERIASNDYNAELLLQHAMLLLNAQPAEVSDADVWELWLRVCAESDNLSTRVMIANFARALRPQAAPMTLEPTNDVGLVPVVIKPFTPAQRRRLWDNSPEIHKDAASITGFERIVSLTERAHGITAPAGGEG